MADRRRKGGLSFYYKEKKFANERLKTALVYLFWAVLAVLLAYFCIVFAGIRTSVVGSSMEPVLYNGQEILIDRFSYNFLRPKRGDVIVFWPNGNENTHFYVKRVVAIPGDRVLIKDGLLYLNGEMQPQLFSDKIAEAGVAETEQLIGEDEYFVMGDNCNNSEDSRSANLGNVNISAIYGRAWYHMAAQREGLGFIK